MPMIPETTPRLPEASPNATISMNQETNTMTTTIAAADKPITLAAAREIHKRTRKSRRADVAAMLTETNPETTPETTPSTPEAPQEGIMQTPPKTKAQEKAEKVAANKAAREAAKVEKAAKAAREKAEKAALKAAGPVLLDGFEVAPSADLETLKELSQKAYEAINRIADREKLGVADYLAFGEFQAQAAPMFKSTKVYGQYLKEKLPASQALDPALRSNCKWLFENLTDVLVTLGLNRIEDHKSSNPTVIKRDFKAAQAKAELRERAQEEGTDEETIAANDKAAAKAEAERIAKDIEAGLEKFQTWLSSSRSKNKYAEATEVLRVVILQGGNKADIAKALLDLTQV